MPDYGHDLMFGAGLDSPSQHPATTVRLAELADRAGLELVAFMDHPYQPAYLDTWTLLSYVAARTSRIRLAASVHPIPMRPPAMLARSSASLDLLSGGRFELGLGAGHYFDAIEAMGGPPRSPGTAVTALAEGIQIIREIWDTDTRGGVNVEGQHYQVRGAKRGPRPAHDIGIWIGAYKPRMLRLTGRVADGWLPSLPAMQPGDLTIGNTIIDEAAEEAGRSPRDIRRLLNPGVELTVDQLVELVLSDGISTFNFEIDGPDTIDRLAHEIAPAVRETVAKERSRHHRPSEHPDWKGQPT
ncbi:LLM class flavin-dependent oxidoreductase [Phytoactinopolyspora mesophila]|uniref:LLM class flavin-dependent oxidoreductase n=1 Tax=Phytoactinopolyspora mesophila TaxID=2650750 RepID=A0A7K3MB53_9ACTN|nr:LLM class flavin-dependent oxidoreductase [Phytoactinopolyspora mesophila]NDL60486.1 LLM class flavin-dependent oxidoreductase [Phytoactinopolyspora mesophila]